MIIHKIYKITNNINGKNYIGQTINAISERWRRHCWTCTSKYNKMPIVHAIKKYGKDNFTINKICECETQEEADRLETFYAKEFNSFSPYGYNLKVGNGHGSLSEEVKEKIRKANTGKIRTQEAREKLRDSHLGNKLSEEAKKKISIINKGSVTSELAKKRCSEVSSKIYDLIDPKGIPVLIYCMRKFCLENGYDTSKMCELVRGKRDQYRGWTRAPNFLSEKVERKCNHQYKFKENFRDGIENGCEEGQVRFSQTCVICGEKKEGFSCVLKMPKSIS